MDSFVVKYQFLDVGVQIYTDSRLFIKKFDSLYAKFRVPDLQAPPDLWARFLEDPPRIILSRKAIPLPSKRSAVEVARGVLLAKVLHKIKNYYLFHAAVVVGKGGALAICGPSGSGKSTLALALMRKGWRVFSDEVCPIHKETGLVHPFPKALELRGYCDPSCKCKAETPRGPVTLFPDGNGGPVALRDIVFLTGGRPNDENIRLFISLVRDPGDRFLAKLKGVVGVCVDDAYTSGPWRRYLITIPSNGRALREVQDVIDQNQRDVAAVIRAGELDWSFFGEPALVPLRLHQGALRMAGQLQRPWNIPERPSEIVGELWDLLRNTRIWEFRVGRLTGAVNLLERLLTES